VGQIGLVVLCIVVWVFLILEWWPLTLAAVALVYVYLCVWFFVVDKKERPDESV
jgi:hypothetical protein